MTTRDSAWATADVLAGLEITGDWTPTPAQRTALRGLEQALMAPVLQSRPLGDGMIAHYAALLADAAPIVDAYVARDRSNVVAVDFRRAAKLPVAA